MLQISRASSSICCIAVASSHVRAKSEAVSYFLRHPLARARSVPLFPRQVCCYLEKRQESTVMSQLCRKKSSSTGIFSTSEWWLVSCFDVIKGEKRKRADKRLCWKRNGKNGLETTHGCLFLCLVVSSFVWANEKKNHHFSLSMF